MGEVSYSIQLCLVHTNVDKVEEMMSHSKESSICRRHEHYVGLGGDKGSVQNGESMVSIFLCDHRKKDFNINLELEGGPNYVRYIVQALSNFSSQLNSLGIFEKNIEEHNLSGILGNK